MKYISKILIVTALCFTQNTFAKDYVSEGQKFTVEKLFDGGEVIWGFDFINKDSADDILFSERSGKLKYLNVKNGKTIEVTGAPKVFVDDQAGLLDVFIDHPNNNIYITFSEAVEKQNTTSLFKGQLSADKTKITGSRIFQAKALDKGGMHYGSRVMMDKEGFLFMTVGERNDRHKAQDLGLHNGKVLRLTQDGKPAPGNPFISDKKALPEIWSYGHRNPQGLFIDSSGAVLVAEFGPRGGDEVNLIQKGKNYGWPVITYGKEYWGPKIGQTEKAGMEQPLFHWVPSVNPSGMMVYSGKAFPKFEGNMFLATLANQHIHRVVMDKDRKMVKEEKLVDDLSERFRQIKTGPDGLIYVSTDSGKLFRLKPVVAQKK